MRPAIVAADLHLRKKSGIFGGRAECGGDDLWSLECIAKLVKEHDADLYLLGDVMDQVSTLPRPMIALQAAIGDLAKEGRIFYTTGQHDANVGGFEEHEPWLALIPGAKHIANTSFDFMGYKAFALSYFASAFENLEFAKVPKSVEVLMLHGTCDLAFNAAFHWQVESLKQFKSLKVVLAGDFHQPLDLVAGQTHIHYTGSTWQIASNEPREKSVILVEKGKKGLEISRLPLKTRKILKLTELYDTNGELNLTDLKDIDTTLPKELQLPVVLIDTPAGPELYEQLAQHAHIYTTSAANPDIPTRELVDKYGELSNAEILQHYVDKEKNPEQFAFALDVIENSAEDAVKRLKDKFGIKDVDHTVPAAPPEINLDAGDEEEEVLA